jgi:hypothetical protein
MTHGYRIDAQRRWTNRNLIHQPDPRRWRRLGATIAAVAVAFAPTLVYLWQQNECLRLSYRVSAQRQRHEQLVETQRRLRLAGAEHESLDAVEAWAVNERGLVPSGPDRIVVVRDLERSRTRSQPDDSGLLARSR